ncbi:MAG: AAA family ATPase [Syntrophales bacterium]|nr:AAA family ATPase [Syntrophales bacterium]
MYTAYHGLRENPFNLTPDYRYFFFSSRHREALNHLLYGIHERKGFIVLTGGIGTGKTTICRALLASLEDSVDTALVFNSFLSDMELLGAVLHELGAKLEMPGGKKAHIDRLNKFLLDNFSAGRNTVLVIDEAQNLSYSALEQIRMLSNLETEREKLIQIVLIGQPELEDILASPSLKQLNDRITVRFALNALSRDECREYISHRLNAAGGGSIRFSGMAHRVIYRASRGNPRHINAICDRALLVAYVKNRSLVDGKTVRNALVDLRGVPARRRSSLRRLLLVLIPVFLSTAAGLILFYRNELTEVFLNLKTYLT